MLSTEVSAANLLTDQPVLNAKELTDSSVVSVDELQLEENDSELKVLTEEDNIDAYEDEADVFATYDKSAEFPLWVAGVQVCKDNLMIDSEDVPGISGHAVYIAIYTMSITTITVSPLC